MQINKLILKNYKQYNDVELNFPEGLTGLIGSNGSGKSTILEAIGYALYGRCSNAKEDIRNDNANTKEPVEVNLIFNDKGKDYRVHRLLKGKALTAGAELYCDDILIASQPTEVNKQIIKLLKIDYKNFKRSYFSEQKDVTALLSMKTGERQIEIRKMLGLEKLDKLEDRIKDHTKELSSRISIKREQLLSEDSINRMEQEKIELDNRKVETEESYNKLNDELLNAKQLYLKAKEQVSEYELLRDKHHKLEKELSVTRSRVSGIEKQISSACEELTVLNQHKEKLTLLLPHKQKYDIVSEKLLRMLNEEARFTRVSSLITLREDNKKFIEDKSIQRESRKDEIAQISPLEQDLKEINLLFSSKEDIIEAKNSLRDTLREIISSAETQLKQKQKRLAEIRKLGKGSPCPECERPLKEHYDKLVAEYDTQIADFNNQVNCRKADLTCLEQEINELKSEKDILSGTIKEIEFRLKKINILQKDIEQISAEICKADSKIKNINLEIESIGEISFDPDKLNILKAEEKTLKPYHTEFSELSIQVKSITVLENKLAGFRSEKDKLLIYETEVAAEIKSNDYCEDQYNSYKENCNIKEQLKDDLQLKFYSIESELKEILNRINILIETLARDSQARNEIRSEEEEIGLYDRLTGFVNFFKQRIASQEMPAISLEASRLFSNITRGRYSDLVIDSDYEIYINRDTNKVLLGTLSGGEKDLAGLCLRIAISKRIAALAGRENMGFLALDEVFGSQDESRREELMNALYQISHDFKQIFVISHNEDVKEAFQNRIHIKKEGKYSTVM